MRRFPEAQVYVECKPDERLLRVLGVPRRKIKHWRDKGRLCRQLEKTEDAVGLIDEDPDSPESSWLRKRQLKEVPEYELKVSTERSRLIVLCPRLEEWVLQAAQESGVSPAQFGLPADGDGLHKVINFRLESFAKLVQELRKRESPRLRQLMNLI